MELGDWAYREQKSARDIARWCHVSVRVVYKWIAGSSIPRPDHLQIIARQTRYAVTADDFHKLTEKRRAAKRATRLEPVK